MQLFVVIVRKYRSANAYIYQIKKINKENKAICKLKHETSQVLAVDSTL